MPQHNRSIKTRIAIVTMCLFLVFALFVAAHLSYAITPSSIIGVDDIIADWKVSPLDSWSSFTTRLNLQLDQLQAHGLNTVNIFALRAEELLDAWTPLGNYGTVLDSVVTEIKSRGIKLWLQCQAIDSAHPLGYYQGWSAWYAFCYDVVYNVGGLGDRYINAQKSLIQRFQPDIVTVASEFATDKGSDPYDPSPAYLQAYIQFVSRAIDDWRTVKSDLQIAVTGIPFWDLKPLINAGAIPRSNVFYTVHYYYSHDGNYPYSYEPWAQSYWNGQFATAKSQLYSDFQNNVGIATARSYGETVVFEALGCHLANPNADVFMQDALEYCRQYSIGYILSGNGDFHQRGSWHVTWIMNESPVSFNAIGQVWADFEGTSTPQYSIVTITTTGQGTTQPSGTITNYLIGDSLTVTAYPDSGWYFDHATRLTQTYADNPFTVTSLSVSESVNVVFTEEGLPPTPPPEYDLSDLFGYLQARFGGYFTAMNVVIGLLVVGVAYLMFVRKPH